MNEILHNFVSLFYPEVCLACENSLYKGEKTLCTWCMYNLPKTNFHEDADNAIIRHFWGKVNIHAAASLYYFNKGQKVQRLIHNLKYKGQKAGGVKVGEIYGHELKKSELFKDVDVIVPVPLHKSKQRARGYNQSDCFAAGLALAMQVPALTKFLKRNRKTESQTKKSRFLRWQNVNEVFSVNTLQQFEGKHFLLADDVITTGSTLTACAEALLKVKNAKVSVVSIAYAHD